MTAGGPHPALGDEGSHRLDVSLQVMDVCSESFFLVLPSALWNSSCS